MTPLECVLIGAGSWSTRHHLPVLTADPQVKIVAVVDPDLQRAADAAHLAERATLAADDVAAYGDVHEMLHYHTPGAAVIATPHTTHVPAALAMLDAGAHVFVEKPLSTNPTDARNLVLIAEGAGLHLAVGYTYQYTPAGQRVRDWLRNELGELHQVIAEFSSRAGALFAAARPDDPYSAHSARNRGGQATTQLSHAIGSILWSTGLRIETVAAMTARRGTPVDVDDVVAFRLSSGATGTAAATGTLTSGDPLRHRIVYLGARGVIEHDLIGGRARLRRTSGTSSDVTPSHTEPAYPAGLPVRHFLDLIRGQVTNLAPGRPAAEAVAVIDAVLRSAAEQRFVDIPSLFDPDTREHS